jgi:hypothetical protein
MVRSIEINAAAYFWGYTDEWRNAEMTGSLQRARGVLAVGVAQLAIEKARTKRPKSKNSRIVERFSRPETGTVFGAASFLDMEP